MAYVQYQKYSFREPNNISRDTYASLREGLLAQPNTIIEPYSESYNDKFKGYINTMKYCGITLLAALIISVPLITIDGLKEWSENGPGYFISCVVATAAGLSLLVGIWVRWYLTVEGGSYSDFEKDKKNYYNRMKTCILKSSSYDEFLLLFNKK